MWAEASLKRADWTAKLAEMRAEFCIFESNAPGLKAYFYESYVDMARADNLVLVKFGFSALSVPRFFGV